MDSEQTVEKSISEADFRRLWQELGHNQRRFAVAMMDYPTKKEAALAVGIEPNTAYKWNGDVDLVIDFLLEQLAASASAILESGVVKAAMLKLAGMDSDDEKTRQGVATEVLDRVLGRATQRQEVDVTTQGESLNVGHTDQQHARAMVSILAAFGEGLLRPDSDEQRPMDAAEHATDGGSVLPSG